MKIISAQMSFKIHFRCGNPPLCRGFIAVPSGPNSHTFTVILAVFAPPPPPSYDGVIKRENVYLHGVTNTLTVLSDRAQYTALS